ncbi:YgfZ/GcvT domain-containing protein [Aquincola sp. J276]|uniref:CAF17-like 4Fe-4S cluster assembly/insertion protein YgfZ n=1 Tax=Aquincola sp. J276 TaxID=2898432 RepID=UPI003857A36C
MSSPCLCGPAADDNGPMDTHFPPSDLNGAVRLAHWGVIRATGAEAASFLHGQLTQDIQNLPPGQARLAGYCSAKGRLLASFIVLRGSADELLLLCSADLLAPTLKRLSMYVLRAKCKLTDASAELAVLGLAGAPALAALGALGAGSSNDDGATQALAGMPVLAAAGGQLVRLPAVEGIDRGLWVGPAEALPAALPALDADAWDALEVRSAVPRIVAATVEQFVPQMINLELVGGVNFQKGCYPGQEVVARSQYRGTTKRRAAVFATGAAAQPGQEVFDANDPGQPAGMVINAAAGQPALALVEVKLAALAEPALRLGSAEGPALRPLPLPYPLPAGAD